MVGGLSESLVERCLVGALGVVEVLEGQAKPGLPGRNIRLHMVQSSLSGRPSSVMSYFSKTAAIVARSAVPFRVAGPSSS